MYFIIREYTSKPYIGGVSVRYKQSIVQVQVCYTRKVIGPKAHNIIQYTLTMCIMFMFMAILVWLWFMLCIPSPDESFMGVAGDSMTCIASGRGSVKIM